MNHPSPLGRKFSKWSTETTEERFWAKVEKTEACWNWLGTIRSDGYGQMVADRKIIQAHRVSYRIANGSLTQGLQIDHLCRNRKCVRPSHLREVTAKVNTLAGQGPAAINSRKTHCWRGHEFNAENTYVHTNGKRVQRHCRKCGAASQQMYRKRKAQ